MRSCLRQPQATNVCRTSRGACIPHVRARHAIVRAGPAVTTTDRTVADAVEAVLSKVPVDRRVALEGFQERLDGIKQLGRDLQLNRVFPERIPGCFALELTTDQRQFSGSVTDMARFTFGKFGPPTLEVDLGPEPIRLGRMETGLPDLYRGKYEGIENGYVLFTHFKVVEPDADPTASPLLGVQAAVAEWGIVEGADGQPPSQLSVLFRRLKLQPIPSVAADSERLARWLKVFQAANPGMDSSGTAEVELPVMPKGLIQYHLMGNELQMHVGNMGSHMILRRFTPPAGTPGGQLAA